VTSERLTDISLLRLSEFVARTVGLHFPRDRWCDLERGVVAASREFDFRDASACSEWLTTAPLTRKQIEILASHLTVGETYFFRDPRMFQLLEEEILPLLIQSRRQADRRLRIWSAGCATGEEAYSVALLLRRLLPDLASWRLTILATDINPRFLQKARQGIYTPWSFRECLGPDIEAQFERLSEGKLRVASRIRELVQFEYLNLAEDAYPSLLTNTNAMDLILCRNVLMYFSCEQARKAAAKLHRSLVEGGWLLVSPSESSHELFSPFVTVSFPGAIVYRKDPCQAPPAAWMTIQEPEPVESKAVITCEPIAIPDLVAPPIEESSVPPPGNPVEEEETKAGSTAYQNALALSDRGHYAEAAEILLAYLGANPAHADAMVLLARALANQGRLEEAREWCEKAIAINKICAPFHYLRATILQEQGEETEAAAALGRALYLDPDFILVHVALGHLRRRQGSPDDSRKHFANALSLLRQRRTDELVPEGEGRTSGRLAEIIEATA